MNRSRLWAAFFLLLFLCVKGLEYHSLEHVDSEMSESCERCDFALLLSETPFDSPGSAHVEKPLMITFDSVVESPSNFSTSAQELIAGQFYRPPPSASIVL